MAAPHASAAVPADSHAGDGRELEGTRRTTVRAALANNVKDLWPNMEPESRNTGDGTLCWTVSKQKEVDVTHAAAVARGYPAAAVHGGLEAQAESPGNTAAALH